MQSATETENVGGQDILPASEAHRGGIKTQPQSPTDVKKREPFQPAWLPLAVLQ